ncbi:hypothetical protein MJL48_30365, partial [Salmonella enterica subsp. enterica serovar Kentucky]|nr:hypothetical protein [Salmonella enterica subsp. enterica serovar Kentucky]
SGNGHTRTVAHKDILSVTKRTSQEAYALRLVVDVFINKKLILISGNKHKSKSMDNNTETLNVDILSHVVTNKYDILNCTTPFSG